jgi:hypothetical protein
LGKSRATYSVVCQHRAGHHHPDALAGQRGRPLHELRKLRRLRALPLQVDDRNSCQQNTLISESDAASAPATNTWSADPLCAPSAARQAEDSGKGLERDGQARRGSKIRKHAGGGSPPARTSAQLTASTAATRRPAAEPSRPISGCIAGGCWERMETYMGKSPFCGGFVAVGTEHAAAEFEAAFCGGFVAVWTEDAAAELEAAFCGGFVAVWTEDAAAELEAAFCGGFVAVWTEDAAAEFEAAKPLVRARCKTSTYCSKDCQVHTAHRKRGGLGIKTVIDAHANTNL